jgi:hypothetical protein
MARVGWSIWTTPLFLLKILFKTSLHGIQVKFFVDVKLAVVVKGGKLGN